jgi:hypothetical protein
MGVGGIKLTKMAETPTDFRKNLTASDLRPFTPPLAFRRVAENYGTGIER